jgi:hypothetical protein
MINLPYVFRNSSLNGGKARLGELPARICGIDQTIWMTARRDTLSGGTEELTPPCSGCVTTWSDQSVNGNDATLLNSTVASGNTEFYPDYWTGDTSNNSQPFISFDRKDFGPDSPNFLNIPYDASFSELTVFTFSTIFRTRRIEPNITTEPDDGASAEVVLFQNGNDTNGTRNDGWGIDYRPAASALRLWYYDNGIPVDSKNEIEYTVTDWTEWMRLTVRVSGNTMEANLYNEGEFIGNSGFTWNQGTDNGSGTGVQYGNIWPANPNWFIGAQKGPDFPGGPDPIILPGSWDIAEYVLYNDYLPNSCINTIWDYYEFRYGITNNQPVPLPPSPDAPTGTLLLDLDATKDTYSDASKTTATGDGDLVYTWGDQSGNVYDAEQSDSAERPIYKTDGDNGEPYVWFDDSFNTCMIIPNDGSFDTSALTIFIVAEITPVNEQDGDNYITNSAGAATSTSDGWRVFVNSWDAPGYATPDIRGQMEDSSSLASATNGEVNQNQVITYRFEENVTNRIRINDLTETTGSTTASIDYSTVHDVVLGARWDTPGSTNSLFLPHKLYRILVYEEYLDNATCENFVSELMTYHNIT